MSKKALLIGINGYSAGSGLTAARLDQFVQSGKLRIIWDGSRKRFRSDEVRALRESRKEDS